MRRLLYLAALMVGVPSAAGAQEYAPPEWTIRLSSRLDVGGQSVLLRALHHNRSPEARANWVEVRLDRPDTRYGVLVTPQVALAMHELLWLHQHGVIAAADEVVATTLAVRVHQDKRRTLTFMCELDCPEGADQIVSIALDDAAADRLNVALMTMASELGVRREVESTAPMPVAAAPARGRISVATQPRATLYVDGEAVGETPIADLVIGIGPHVLRVVREGFETVVDSVTVRPTGTLIREYNMQRTAAQEILDRGGGQLTVFSRPFAAVYAGDELLGETPLREVALRAGPHILRVERAGFETVTDTILILGGTLLRRTYELAEGGEPPAWGADAAPAPAAEPAPMPGTEPSAAPDPAADSAATAPDTEPATGRLTITAAPTASVWLDGLHIGDTPILGVSIESGTYVIELVRDGYAAIADTVVVSGQASVRKSYRLQRRPR